MLRQKEMSLIEQLRSERRVGNLSFDDGAVGADGFGRSASCSERLRRKKLNPWSRNNACR